MSQNKLKILFFGSGTFAAPILRKLLTIDNYDICGVVTQPDRPSGRRKEMTAVPVKKLLDENGFASEKIFQPDKIKDEYVQILNKAKPDLILVADYGQILPESLLDFPQYKSINIHASLLPKWRGAVPINAAILAGERTTGITFMRMTAGLDEGPMLSRREVPISEQDNRATLELSLAQQAGDMLADVIDGWVNGLLVEQPQDNSLATYAPASLISKDKAKFSVDVTPEELQRLVRGMYPWPVAWCNISLEGKQKRLKVYRADIDKDLNNADSSEKPGNIFKNSGRLFLRLNEGNIELLELQLEGLKRMQASSYLYLSSLEETYIL
ncbi:MAG: Methionyl-tRNA formyltransferase [candidate division WS6 bacterium OLB21]|uniref:Methionyl-tRNA formyltransferase n=2 Tax=Candidatus Dojkabacteria TaxID=74243 RepID=A0A136KG95_9BACT|nr:MAG: Methionyl-tRNA formyltransferase [candidate division WS6 bacterium OLB21]